MSMCLGLCTLGDENIRKVLADPPLIWKVIAPDDPEAYEYSRKERSIGFLAKLFGRAPKPGPVRAELSFVEGEAVDTDLDKAWHGIHYMFTRTAWEGEAPLNFLVSGGCQVGDIEVGYGPARVFSAKEAQAISEALRSIDRAYLEARFNPKEMMKLEIYPTIWDRDPAEDDTFGYCAEYFDLLKEFIGEASERNLGLVIYLL